MSRPRSSRPDPGADPDYPALKARIIARTGHHYYIDKDELLIERLHRRLRASARPDCAAYAALLSDGAAGEAEWARLEAEITVGETFFFRYAEQFEALRTTILPSLIAARASERTLRIWSAGCSTGAEPYSLAILVRELLGDALADWRVTILGTDISTEALATARGAEYGRWALRTMPPEDRLRYFTRLPSAPGTKREGGYALRPEFRGLVRFERGNLLALAELGPPGEGYDLILCRNVLIYFDARTVSAVVHGLSRRLKADGWLLLGHAEPSPAFAHFVDAVSLPGTVAYRRPSEVPPPSPAPPDQEGRTGPDEAGSPPGRVRGTGAPDTAPARPRASAGEGDRPDVGDRVRAATGPAGGGPEHGSAPPAGKGRDADPAVPSRPRNGGDPAARAGDAPGPGIESGRPGEDEAEDVARIRALADAGETGAAWRALRAALERDPTDPILRFYEGMLARSLGRDAEAERALRAALYLDRRFVLAHYHLGLLLIARGRPDAAARALDNAVALSQALAADTVLPEGDGASAGEIAAGAAAARAGLGRAIRSRSS
ncbi:CheR family methyltransferase [Methylobacterium sp. J-070]|uniref:CheR family methyltransferase n=1 Tax=Methylobacterium sp. J-070 TaxID=2836650 RepID=UPI001FBB9E1F|nr:protein-glutamate O-methyltransferase CheR [Methylobacterium sp. J-070]MCJ2050896.1 protein-glutamate methyltransferase [Methylobacterium sp. J-070]